MWEKNVNINEIKELRTRTLIYFGVGAIQKINEISKKLKSQGIDKVIVMSGRNAYKATGAWDVVEKAFKDNGIGYVNYDKVTPNPTTDHVNEAAKMALDFKAKAVIAIGGGSPTDAGKSVAILLKYPDKTAEELIEGQFEVTQAVPIISINLTHGTGTETNRFAVVSNLAKNFKPVIAYDCIYPTYAIDDPQLMTKLSQKQTRFVSVDAVNHVIEAATSAMASPYSITLAKEVVELVAKYLPKALENPDDLEARYFLSYAATMGGVAFDNGLLHYTHALEHPLSAVKPELSHGLGLAMLLPSVKSYILADVLAPIVSGLTGNPDEAEKAAKGVENWLKSVGVPEKLEDEGFTENDVEKLVKLTFETPSLGLLLSVAPCGNSENIVREIYKSSLKPMV